MSSVTDNIYEINKNITKLLNFTKKLKHENEKLNIQITELKKEKEALNNKYNALKLAKNITGDKQATLETTLKINELVREIDKCIAMLNR
ncbi:MAG: hypothetical protein D6707_11245 [Bacteroidetes bacterium]|nr:MAG: hypothetical protein D6707_11245 [Bacteroidota bacterium]